MKSHICLIVFISLLLGVTDAQRNSAARRRNGNNNRNGDIRGRSAGISVVQASPRNGTVVKQGQSVRLSCQSSMQWFFCVWKGPGGDKQCAIQEQTPQNVCTVDDRIILEGNQNNCDILLRNARPEDYGQWACLVTDAINFNSDKAIIELEVGVPSSVGFKENFGKDNTLTITEGETAKITCEALGGHPAPKLSWEEPQSTDVDISAQPLITNNADHTTDVRHTIKYKADLRDNNRQIGCVATQVDRDGRTVLYEDKATVQLKVEKLILPKDNALTQKIGIISGVLLAVIFLILLCVFVIFAVCKRRRKRSRPPSSTGTEDTSPEEPPIKPIWTTPMVAATQQQHHHSRHVQRLPHHLSNTVSQGTVSTQSTSSQASWEEDRSVGGEVEDASIQRCPNGGQNGNLHETHFGGQDDLDLPRTILHHPDPFLQQPQRSQRPSYAGRPSSSMLENHPMYYGRPQSAMDSTNQQQYVPRRMPTPNGQLTTSVKSVFDCELGCFIEDEDGDIDSNKPSPSKSEGAHSHSPVSPVSPVSAISRTSEPRDV